MTAPSPTKATAPHTPTPWTLGDKFLGTVDGFAVYGFPISADGQSIARVHAGTLKGTFGNEKANADFIIRAVNCHDDLVAALQNLVNLARMRGSLHEYGALFTDVEALIAKASA